MGRCSGPRRSARGPRPGAGSGRRACPCRAGPGRASPHHLRVEDRLALGDPPHVAAEALGVRDPLLEETSHPGGGALRAARARSAAGRTGRGRPRRSRARRRGPRARRAGRRRCAWAASDVGDDDVGSFHVGDRVGDAPRRRRRARRSRPRPASEITPPQAAPASELVHGVSAARIRSGDRRSSRLSGARPRRDASPLRGRERPRTRSPLPCPCSSYGGGRWSQPRPARRRSEPGRRSGTSPRHHQVYPGLLRLAVAGSAARQSSVSAMSKQARWRGSGR